MFNANHTPTDYTGHLLDENGETWSADGLSSEIGTATSNGTFKYDLQITNIPQDLDEMTLPITYTSNWKNGVSRSANTYYVDVINVIAGVLTSSGATGNPVLFAAVDQWFANNNVSHSDNNSFDSLELKNVSGTLNLASLASQAGVSASSLTTLDNNRYYVIKYLKNVTGFNFSGTGLTEAIDTSVIP